ncbi:hypothetical protein IAG44_30750 [Streptomyces roseirectus]|uniref:Uncharacterized protein n=1 Tax=Streptomyces roseirectus TaxID=2768066 RepID=A0A7H0IKT0_9ACTN|nr:hypothetical protein [Streptomyces roseirectus]QNP73396.1 hypothetical protein IAG44_30750 [Streptomyces roseirectus]
MTLPVPLPHSPRSATAPPPISNIPDQGLPFQGRDEQIADLMRLFSRYGHVLLHDDEPGQGFGKTQMAIAYCRRYTRRYDVAWWFECSGEPDGERLSALIDAQYRELLARCAAQTDGARPETRPDSRWLFVYDNVSDPDRIYDHFVPGTSHRLVTSRAKGETWGENHLSLGGLSEAVAMALLMENDLTPEQAEHLAHLTNGHPGALLNAAETVYQVGYDAFLDQLKPIGAGLDTPPHGIPVPPTGSLLSTTDKRTLFEALLRSPVNRTRDTFDLWVESIRLAINPLQLTPMSDTGSLRNRTIAIVNFAVVQPHCTVLCALVDALEEQDDHEATRVVRRIVDKAVAAWKANRGNQR